MPVQPLHDRTGRKLGIVLRAYQAACPYRLLAGLLLLAALAGCKALAGSDGPTPLPPEYLKTAVALTVQAGKPVTPSATNALAEPTAGGIQPTTPAQRLTLTPSPTPRPSLTPTPSQTPTASRTPTNTPFWVTWTMTPTRTPETPVDSIQIFSPGPASKVVSPIKLSSYLLPGSSGRVRVELLGEKSSDDGPFLYRKVLNYGTSGARVQLYTEIDFELPSGIASEIGRLQIVTEDEYGRIQSKASVDLILLSMGEADINPANNQEEKIIIRVPGASTLVQGNSLRVSGVAHPNANQVLVMQLMDNRGAAVGPARLAAVPMSADNSYVPFSVDVPFSVSEPTWARLWVMESSDGRIPGITHLSSTVILLSP